VGSLVLSRMSVLPSGPEAQSGARPGTASLRLPTPGQKAARAG
jgi:hypothetical protein